VSTAPPPQDPYQQQPPQYQPYPAGGEPPPAWPQAGASPDVYGVPRYADPRGRPLAEYGDRVIAYLIDALIAFALTIPGTLMVILATAPAWDGNGTANGGLIFLGVLLILLGSLVAIWNQGWTQGATGQSWGKRARRIRLVAEMGGSPIGGGLGLVRYLIRNILSGITGVYWLVTVLFPLWDDKRQTLEDKMLKTVVVSER
jgi:uncharacterized RDD family membrane protein YckC